MSKNPENKTKKKKKKKIKNLGQKIFAYGMVIIAIASALSSIIAYILS